MLDKSFEFRSPVATKEINIRKPDGSDEYITDIVAYGTMEVTGHKTLKGAFNHVRDYFNIHKEKNNAK